MEIYKVKKFNIPKIKGISEKQIEEHLKLYSGYVTHTNKILSQKEKDPYLASELQRRLSFEFDGMRNHEYYFGALEGGPKEFPKDGLMTKVFIEQFGSLDVAHEEFKKVAMSRGSGWAIIYWDKVYNRFQYAWIDEHHLGHLSSLKIILAVDMWEHAFMIDYLPGEKSKYLDAYLKAVNWRIVEKWFTE